MFFKILALKHFAIPRIKKRLQHRYFPVRSSHREVFLTKGVTAQKIKFSIKDFFSKCDQILRIYWRNPSWKTLFFVQCVIFCMLIDVNILIDFLLKMVAQQTFVLMKTSWRSFVFVFRRRLQDVFQTSWSRRICSP